MISSKNENAFNGKRRTFLKSSLLLGVASLLPGAVLSGEKNSSRTSCPFVRVGGPIFKKEEDPEMFMKAARDLKYRAVYVPGYLSLNDLANIRKWREAAEKYGLIFAEAGIWCNLMDSSPDQRKSNFDQVVERLALADEIGARCCVDVAGKYLSEKSGWPVEKNLSKEFFDLSVENARKIIDAVKPKRTKFAYEAMGWAIPHTPDSYLQLLKAIGRKEFGVHLDICNMINSPEKFWNSTALIRESFEKLGQWVVSCHAKDLLWKLEMNIHFIECVIGQGNVDYAAYLKCIAALPGEVPLMMEHLKSREEYIQSRDHIFKVAAANGISCSAKESEKDPA
ncbi:MAG: TIM barrel protein [Planctomycetia bacterium]|nr:TIM barrel protein [Planctomycetia bacterium]